MRERCEDDLPPAVYICDECGRECSNFYVRGELSVCLQCESTYDQSEGREVMEPTTTRALDLAQLGRKMRDAQQKYFRSARRREYSQDLLEISKILEREFDAACAAIIDEKAPGGLFESVENG